jgi:hypothetical protein
MKLVFFSFLYIATIAFGQDTIQKVVVLKDVTVIPKRKIIKPVSLYDESVAQAYSIKGFDQLEIFDNAFSEEIWSTKNVNCISLEMKADVSDTFLQVKWNKDQDGCDWVGMGYGWDMWTGKDMAAVRDTLAIQLMIRSTSKPFTNIPWAFGFEDYSGNQAWLGYNKSFLMAKEIGTDWTKVEIPVSLFPFEENDFDLFNVKQLIVQLFSEGIIEINSIELVPFSRKLKEELIVTTCKTTILIDGESTDWKTSEFTRITGGHQMALHYTPEVLYIGVHVNDSTALQNVNKGADLWKGDAVEIAFATNNEADEKRTYFLLSDQHIGINCGVETYAWDFKRNTALNSLNYKLKQEESGYFLELALPLKEAYSRSLMSGTTLGFELAIDLGSEANVRIQQDRWNSPSTEGFHVSPSKWGRIRLK